MTTFNTLVSAVKAIVSPATAKAPAASKAEAAPQVKMAADSLKLGKRPVEEGYVALQRAQIRMADAIGQNRDAIAASKAQEANADGFHEQLAIQAGRGALVRDGEKLLALGRVTGRLAANSTATDADRHALAAIVAEVTSGKGISNERFGALVAKAEDVVRNAGRKVATDRGLANATQQLVGRIGAVETQITQLEHEMTADNSAENLQKIQMKLMDLNQQRDLLLAFKGQADRLANRRDASPADLASMKSLLNGATQMTSPEELRAFLTEAEFVARNAGGPAGDRGVHEATKALAVRVGTIETQIAHLVDEAQGDVSSEALQKIQIKIADLARDKDTLLAFKGQADRIANSRDELDPGDRATLLEHLQDATGDISPEGLYRMLGDLQAIGR